MASEKLKKYVKSVSEEKQGLRIDKKTAVILYIILAVVSLALLVMAVFASASGKAALYPKISAVIFILLGGAISVSLVVYNPRKSFYDLGFYILHTGIVIFLAGMMIFTLGGSSHYVSLPDISSVTDSVEAQMKSNYGWSNEDMERLRSYRNQIGTDEGEIIDLGFNFRIADFETEYYEDGKSVKHYEGTVEFFLSDGTIEQTSLTVNHPLYRGGWKIYLMNVGVSPYGYEQVNLLMKKDPAEFLTTAGIVLIIVGTFMMCLLPKGKSDFRRKKRGVTVNDSVAGSQ